MNSLERRLNSSDMVWWRSSYDKLNPIVWLRTAAILMVVYLSKKHLLDVVNWKDIKGYEAYWIAKAMVMGEGYSFPGENRWLFDDLADGSYHATAWMDPMYTYILAGFIWLFDEYHQLAAALFNLFLYIAVLGLFYYLTKRLFSEKVSLLAMVLLAFSLSSSTFAMNGTYFATMFILLSTVALVAFFDGRSVRRAVVLGVSLGLTALACASAQFFIPVTVAAIVVWGGRNYKLACTHGAVVLVAALTVMAPWMIRNYMVFEEVITVRNGAGQIAFVGVVAVAGTVNPELVASAEKPDWRAKTLRRAVYKARGERLIALEDWQRAYAKEVGPRNWSAMNEAQRDKWFLREATRFIADNPVVSVQLALAKVEVFVRKMGWTGVGVVFLACLGALTTLRNPVGFTVTLWIGAYAAPFLLIICYYNRYRIPIEPLLVLLAMYAVCWGWHRLSSPYAKSGAG